jgi:acetyl esterase/lipase|eukprot:jgi/Chrpa1/136/Chrysochromulina_OHIO_Genome00009073-RA
MPCYRVDRRPRARGLGKPIYGPDHWGALPSWILLHSERGTMRKCWQGHRLYRARQDGRRHGACNECKCSPCAGSPILVCAECKFSICAECNSRPRMPPLDHDPLFCGPHSPRLLIQPTAIAGKGKGTVIVVPGGNYEFLCPKEGLPIVEWLSSHGIAAAVLRYRLLPHHDHQEALDDLDAAAALVRQARGGPVAAIGFSAGGHLVASHALRAHKRKQARVQTRSAHPDLDAQLLIYPAIDGSPWLDPEKADFYNRGQGGMPKKARVLDEPTDALLGGEGFAAPPTFLVGSIGDTICPPREHSDLYAEALREHGVEHCYVRKNLGEHGFALGEDPSWWTRRALHWLYSQGFGHTEDEDCKDGASSSSSHPSSPSPLTVPETHDGFSLLPLYDGSS